ncbi:hypothetical protein HYPSUDRAFT_783543 [Hypholoma sublateritium FD-334 SS-4]|uniref:Uncharacterized protein n=1 Tax=Hypholoma sublateritium (strain FD-334 SS-4) TaxID=945553 RepID=A0A0D2NPJ6_HYPSF|nr:hypothetical protein HYPSUDRAFT_783543 [Hypholoma sublateritium FD-334 SS-4]
MSLTSYATIKAEDTAVYSKFTAKGGMWVNPADHDEGVVATSYSVNSDVTIPKFWSAGRIFIKTGKGITIKGPISGGPTEGQTIVGSGTWTKA